MTELSDDLLVAYVDGQLARDQSRAVKRVLDQDHVVAHRAESLRLAHDRLEWVLESLLEDERALLLGDIDPPPPSPPPRPSVRDRIAQWGTATLLGSAGAVALVGLFAGYAIWGAERRAPVGAQGVDPIIVGALPASVDTASDKGEAVTEETAAASRTPDAEEPIAEEAPAIEMPVVAPPVEKAAPGWEEEVARAQALLGRESFEVGLESQGNLDFVRFQLAKAIGADLVIPDLTAEGLKFTRAQILRHRGEPLAQLSYLPAAGDPVALYVKPEAGDQSDKATQTIAGITTVTWSGNGVKYVLTGRSSGGEIDRIATAARQQTLGL